MIGERIRRARLAAGLSQRDLAERSGLSAMAISKFERGVTAPTSSSLLRIAGATDTRTEYFLRPQEVSLGQPAYRTHGPLGVKQRLRIEADVREQLERFFELLGSFPSPPVPAFDVPDTLPAHVESLEDAEAAAAALREAWNLGTNPIPALADTLEEKGFLIVSPRVEAKVPFDGLATRIDRQAVLVVGADWPGDRQRFTLAHELGHLVLEGRTAAALDLERACNRFAGAFLCPSEAVVQELGRHRTRVALGELYFLKHKYGMSMQAWAHRALEAEVIDRATYRELRAELERSGGKSREVGDPVLAEVPRLFERLILRGVVEDLFSLSKGAELLGTDTAGLRDLLRVEGPGAAPRG